MCDCSERELRGRDGLRLIEIGTIEEWPSYYYTCPLLFID
jgi:hypothetical protein